MATVEDAITEINRVEFDDDSMNVVDSLHLLIWWRTRGQQELKFVQKSRKFQLLYQFPSQTC